MYKPLILPHFHRQLKRYAKKYRHIKEAVARALEDFRKDQYPHLGNNVYKIRVRSKDVSKGKSGSFRLLILIIEVKNLIVPLVIYFKGEQEDITRKEINDHLEVILWELKLQKFLSKN